MKRQFLALYDYGLGGRWALVRAESVDEIRVRFPELKVTDERPGWMTDDYYRRLEDRICDIDQPIGLLADILNDRK
jgi:hypothetical protein